MMKIERKRIAILSVLFFLIPTGGSLPAESNGPRANAVAPSPEELSLDVNGHTDFGDWNSVSSVNATAWKPGLILTVRSSLRLAESHIRKIEAKLKSISGIVLLVTAERTFDAEGRMRVASDENMSTLVTPTGLAIEGGSQGVVTARFGGEFRAPVDELVVLPLPPSKAGQPQRRIDFEIKAQLPEDLPPGIYRLRLDYGFKAGEDTVSLNNETFGWHSIFREKPVESHLYLPPARASGKHVSGRFVDAGTIRPRVPWVILSAYNSNGYSGVVADEDKGHFALSGRNLIQDDVILPLFGDDKQPAVYNLEPIFPLDHLEARSNIPWKESKGKLNIQVTGPQGQVIDLGTEPFTKKTDGGLTTGCKAFTEWQPWDYGRYTVKVTGWTEDLWGNRYQGGGNYSFWIANRMTMATPTFQGAAFPVGSRYGRDISFSPAVPAEVEVTAVLYPDSDPAKARTIRFGGKASPAGVFGTAQGAKGLPLDAPGEYYARIFATYTDRKGALWIGSLSHAGVVYPLDSTIIARGKKLAIGEQGDQLADRGETHKEGRMDNERDEEHLEHINFPFQARDVLLIASDQQYANKIEPVLTYETKVNPAVYDEGLQEIGASNVKLRTSTGYSPHLFPEYITEWAYYYAAAPRPGMMSRFIVAENGANAPYWHTSPNDFGGQINSSSNGDLPGDIYRLLGGVVLRKKGEKPAYAGYVSNAIIIPKGSNNNRVIAPGSEEILGPDGKKAHFFVAGLRPGTVYEQGDLFAPAGQINPIVPATVAFVLTYPDGHSMKTSAACDDLGSFVGAEKWPLDQPGVYRFTLKAAWEGHQGAMPGLPTEGGVFYVIEKNRPAGGAGLRIFPPKSEDFSPTEGFTVTGYSSGSTVHYAAVIPGAAIMQGSVPVKRGYFELKFDPLQVNKKVSTYDIVNRTTKAPEIGRVVHLTFFSEETGPDGKVVHDFQRLILRGTKIVDAK